MKVTFDLGHPNVSFRFQVETGDPKRPVSVAVGNTNADGLCKMDINEDTLEKIRAGDYLWRAGRTTTVLVGRKADLKIYDGHDFDAVKNAKDEKK